MAPRASMKGCCRRFMSSTQPHHASSAASASDRCLAFYFEFELNFLDRVRDPVVDVAHAVGDVPSPDAIPLGELIGHGLQGSRRLGSLPQRGSRSDHAMTTT